MTVPCARWLQKDVGSEIITFDY
uniref:Uncharacterized protein n=1 Tax=Arundo donax TaxID=35708 RepID=A0A0A9B748_ARUDO